MSHSTGRWRQTTAGCCRPAGHRAAPAPRCDGRETSGEPWQTPARTRPARAPGCDRDSAPGRPRRRPAAGRNRDRGRWHRRRQECAGPRRGTPVRTTRRVHSDRPPARPRRRRTAGQAHPLHSPHSAEFPLRILRPRAPARSPSVSEPIANAMRQPAAAISSASARQRMTWPAPIAGDASQRNTASGGAMTDQLLNAPRRASATDRGRSDRPAASRRGRPPRRRSRRRRPRSRRTRQGGSRPRSPRRLPSGAARRRDTRPAATARASPIRRATPQAAGAAAGRSPAGRTAA